jgi:hypothetical protein
VRVLRSSYAHILKHKQVVGLTEDEQHPRGDTSLFSDPNRAAKEKTEEENELFINYKVPFKKNFKIKMRSQMLFNFRQLEKDG